MKAKLLKKIRKRFDYKFVYPMIDGRKTFVVFDKLKSNTHWHTIGNLYISPTHFLLQLFDAYWRDKYEQKKELIKFKKL